MAKPIETYASVIASAVSDAFLESPGVEIEDIEWGRGSSLNYEVRRAIVNALKPDLYLTSAEERDILGKAKDEFVLVDAVLKELRDNQPLFKRVAVVQYFLKKPDCRLKNFLGDCILSSTRKELQQEIRNKLKPALQKAAGDSDPVVSDKAKILLDQLDETPKLKASNR